MPKTRKLEWISPGQAAPIAGLTRTAINYRALKGQYRSKQDERTGTLLVNRKDVEREARKERREQAAKAAAETGDLAVA